MEHDDRTRAQNLARLRRPRKDPSPTDQLQLGPTFASYATLDTLTISLANALVQLLQLLEECPMPESTRDEFAALRDTISLGLDHFRDLRANYALQSAIRSLYSHLGGRVRP